MPPHDDKGKEWRFVPNAKVRLEQRDDHVKVIRGLGSVYYDGTPKTEFELFPGAVERIMPGAFSRALKEGDDVVGLFNHDPNQVLGRRSANTLMLTDSDKGLKYEISPPDTTVGRDVLENVRVGNVTGSSFSFRVLEETWRDEGDLEVREVKDVELFDVGPVVFPAYSSATAEAASADGRRSRKAWMAHRDLTKADEWLKVHQLPAKGQAP